MTVCQMVATLVVVMGAKMVATLAEKMALLLEK